MRRPSHQARLFVFGLLKTASALASSTAGPAKLVPHPTAFLASTLASSPPELPTVIEPKPCTIQVRCANQHDIPSLSACNLATLPENYNHDYYSNHMRDFPDLAFVCIEEEQVVAYLLGKIISRDQTGHVSSLAVLPNFRRQGLARTLMEQFEYTVRLKSVDSVGLHVRKSNTAARGLYENAGYTVSLAIPKYYEDGEDAYYMRKTLDTKPPSLLESISNRWQRKVPEHLRIPRLLNLQKFDDETVQVWSGSV